MTTDRVYRDAMTHDEAVAELRANAGAQFDPKVVEALIRVVAPMQQPTTASVEEVRAILATQVPQRVGAST